MSAHYINLTLAKANVRARFYHKNVFNERVRETRFYLIYYAFFLNVFVLNI